MILFLHRDLIGYIGRTIGPLAVRFAGLDLRIFRSAATHLLAFFLAAESATVHFLLVIEVALGIEYQELMQSCRYRRSCKKSESNRQAKLSVNMTAF